MHSSLGLMRIAAIVHVAGILEDHLHGSSTILSEGEVKPGVQSTSVLQEDAFITRRDSTAEQNEIAMSSVDQPDLPKRSNAYSSNWTIGSSSFRLVLDVSCADLPRDTIIGDYRLLNGSTVNEARQQDVLIDDLNMRRTSDNWYQARIDGLLANANAALSEIEQHSISPDAVNEHIELRRLLSIGGAIVDSIAQKVEWTAYLAPQLIAPTVIGYIFAKTVPLMNTTRLTENEVQTMLVVAGTTFVAALVINMQQSLTQGSGPKFLTRSEITAIRVFVAWIRRAIRILFASMLGRGSPEHPYRDLPLPEQEYAQWLAMRINMDIQKLENIPNSYPERQLGIVYASAPDIAAINVARTLEIAEAGGSC